MLHVLSALHIAETKAAICKSHDLQGLLSHYMKANNNEHMPWVRNVNAVHSFQTVRSDQYQTCHVIMFLPSGQQLFTEAIVDTMVCAHLPTSMSCPTLTKGICVLSFPASSSQCSATGS